jgi:hypothetical protein
MIDEDLKIAKNEIYLKDSVISVSKKLKNKNVQS